MSIPCLCRRCGKSQDMWAVSREFVQGSGLLGLEGWTSRPQITPQRSSTPHSHSQDFFCSLGLRGLSAPCLWPKERAGRVALPPPPIDRCV